MEPDEQPSEAEQKAYSAGRHTGKIMGRTAILKQIRGIVEGLPYTGGNEHDDMGKLISRSAVISRLQELDTLKEN